MQDMYTAVGSDTNSICVSMQQYGLHATWWCVSTVAAEAFPGMAEWSNAADCLYDLVSYQGSDEPDRILLCMRS